MILMLGKLINGQLVIPSEQERQMIVIANPTEDSLKYNLGYKDLYIDEKPEYNKVTQYLNPVFEETDTEIIRHWQIVDLSENIVE